MPQLHFSRKRSIIAGLVGALVAAALGLGLLFWIARSVGESMASINDPNRYQEVLQRLRDEKWPYAAHFPAAIPISATGTQFQFMPGAMQGWTRIELSYTLPLAEFSAIEQLYSTPTLMPLAAADFDWPALPPGFRNVILGYSPSTSTTSGYRFGVALDSRTKQVWYWAEDPRD